MLSTRRSISALAALSVVAAGTVALTTSPASAADHFPLAYGLTADDRIVSFLVEQPGAAPRSSVAIGKAALGEDVVGLDIRPVTGEVYVLIDGAAGGDRLAVVDPVTGALSKSVPLSTQLAGASFGVDFNPAVDRLRIVSDTEQNLRVNVDTGAVLVDKPLVYKAGDVGAGTNPAVTSVAYENNIPGGLTTATPVTELYGIDVQRDSMIEIDPPNDGVLSTVGSGLGVGDVTAVSGFDIAGSDLGSPKGYAVLTVAGVDALYTVNTDTGTAAKAGDFPAATTVEDLTIADPRFVIDAAASGTEGGPVTVDVRRMGDLRFAGAVSFRTVDGVAVAGSDFTAATGTLSFAAGETVKRITLQTAEDSAAEGPEAFTVVLSAPTGQNSTLGRSTSTVTVVDNEDGRAYGLTTGNQLVTFSVNTPGTVSARTAVTGLQANEDLVGIDVRPATSELYAIGSTSRVYRINPANGAATAVASTPFTPALSGTSFGVDFNPVVDRIRVVSNDGQNLRLHPDTGQVAFVDRTLAYAAGDPGTGTPPRVGAAAYSNNGPGATSTELYEIEVARDALVTQTPPNDGTLVTDGPLGVTISDTATVGLDIASAGGAAFAVFTADGTTAPSLYRVNLDTGRASVVGLLGDATVEDLSVVAISQIVAPAPTASATPTATMSPRPSPSGVQQTPCTTPASITLDRSTIIATGSAQITVRATANSIVDVFAYSRPSTTYRVVRSAELGADGVAVDRIVPPTNTRLYAQQRGCNASPSIVLNVRTQISLNVVRNGVRNYTFSGRLLPARPGGLIASLYRVTSDGRQILAAQTRASATTGQYTIVRQFTGDGRFGFVVRTGQDLQNAPGSSNVRSLLVF